MPETRPALSRSAWLSRELREPPRMWPSTSTAAMSGSPPAAAPAMRGRAAPVAPAAPPRAPAPVQRGRRPQRRPRGARRAGSRRPRSRRRGPRRGRRGPPPRASCSPARSSAPSTPRSWPGSRIGGRPRHPARVVRRDGPRRAGCRAGVPATSGVVLAQADLLEDHFALSSQLRRVEDGVEHHVGDPGDSGNRAGRGQQQV